MARFYATIQGNRGKASRMGTKDSGIQGHLRGWKVGIRVIVSTTSDDEDFCTVWLTGGSHDGSKLRLLGTFKESDLG